MCVCECMSNCELLCCDMCCAGFGKCWVPSRSLLTLTSQTQCLLAPARRHCPLAEQLTPSLSENTNLFGVLRKVPKLVQAGIHKSCYFWNGFGRTVGREGGWVYFRLQAASPACRRDGNNVLRRSLEVASPACRRHGNNVLRRSLEVASCVPTSSGCAAIDFLRVFEGALAYVRLHERT